MLRKLLREHDPPLVGIAWDVGGKTFRKERFADYKATRSPMPDELRAQMPYVRQALEAFKIPILELAGYEADDVIGTLACKAADEGYQVVLVSADKDLMQLVGDRVSFFHTGRDKVYDRGMVVEDFGVPPEQVPDVLALMGDTIDNVPGVPGHRRQGREEADPGVRLARESARARRRRQAQDLPRGPAAARRRRPHVEGAGHHRLRSADRLRSAVAGLRASRSRRRWRRSTARWSSSRCSRRWRTRARSRPRSRSRRRASSTRRRRGSRRSPACRRASISR